jgi:hypothetical protein
MPALAVARFSYRSLVGPFALGVIMVDDQAEARAVAGGGPFEHREIAVRVAGGEDRALADVADDADGLARLVVDEADAAVLHQRRRAVGDGT